MEFRERLLKKKIYYLSLSLSVPALCIHSSTLAVVQWTERRFLPRQIEFSKPEPSFRSCIAIKSRSYVPASFHRAPAPFPFLPCQEQELRLLFMKNFFSLVRSELPFASPWHCKTTGAPLCPSWKKSQMHWYTNLRTHWNVFLPLYTRKMKWQWPTLATITVSNATQTTCEQW